MTSLRVLEPAEVSGALIELRQLADLGVAADHNEPFGDQTWVELRAGRARLVVSSQPGALTAAAAVVLPDNAAQPALVELLVAPDARGHGLGRQLVAAVRQVLADHLDPTAQVTAWSHGDHPAARRLAAASDLQAVRTLYRMSLPVASAAWDTPALASDYRIRTFRPGVDDAAWLELNATAFAEHPEQGQPTQQDLDARMAEDWFDPRGFFLAVNAADVPVGFHWTKIPVGSTAGEVYAVGVDPATQGTGLGRALTVHGMQHLAAAGCDEIVLYVDESNRPAVSLYTALGFGVANTDVMFSTKR